MCCDIVFIFTLSLPAMKEVILETLEATRNYFHTCFFYRRCVEKCFCMSINMKKFMHFGYDNNFILFKLHSMFPESVIGISYREGELTITGGSATTYTKLPPLCFEEFQYISESTLFVNLSENTNFVVACEIDDNEIKCALMKREEQPFWFNNTSFSNKYIFAWVIFTALGVVYTWL